MEKFWTDTASAVLAGIIAPGILGVVALATPGIRKWLADRQHLWHIAFITALLTAIMSSVVISLFLRSKTIVVTAYRVGQNGIEGQTRDNKTVQPFSKTQGLQPILEAENAPICTLSNIYINFPPTPPPSSCELHRDGSHWKIQVQGDIQCRVTCFTMFAQ